MQSPKQRRGVSGQRSRTVCAGVAALASRVAGRNSGAVTPLAVTSRWVLGSMDEAEVFWADRREAAERLGRGVRGDGCSSDLQLAPIAWPAPLVPRPRNYTEPRVCAHIDWASAWHVSARVSSVCCLSIHSSPRHYCRRYLMLNCLLAAAKLSVQGPLGPLCSRRLAAWSAVCN